MHELVRVGMHELVRRRAPNLSRDKEGGAEWPADSAAEC